MTKTPPLRVAMISEHGDPLAPLGGQQSGGQNIFVFELARSLSKQGVRVDVFTRWDNRKASQIVRFAKYAKVVRLKAGPRHFIPKDKFGKIMPEFVEHLLEYTRLKKTKYDLVHTHYYFSGWAGMQIKNIFKIPQIHTYHSLGLTKAKVEKDASFSDRKKIEKKILDISDRIIATTGQEKKTLLSLGKYSKEKVSVIPAGVNLHRFTPKNKMAIRKKLGLSEKKKIIVYAGRMEKNKGGDILVQAIDQIKKHYPKVFSEIEVYMFSGDPRKIQKREKEEQTLRRRIRQLISDSNLGETIKLHNGITQEKLHYYLTAADLVVVPSFYESFGLIAIEAMASGTPVVVSNVGGLKATVKDGVTGFHAQVGKPSDFAKKMVKVLKNDKLAKRLSQNAIDRVHKNYDWDRIASETLDVYKEVVKK